MINDQPLLPGERGRLLGSIRLAGIKATRASDDLERQIVRAAARGCSMRELAKAAGFGSHRKVQELLARHAQASTTVTASTYQRG